jgi:hemolysin D
MQTSSSNPPVDAPHGRRAREAYEFLPAALEVLEKPPHPAARVVLGVIVTFIVVALAWSIWGRIDQVAMATGQIVPTTRAQLIQPIENGIVRAIHVRDGQRVKAGDLLLELDPTEASASVEAARSERDKARLDLAVADALLADAPLSALVVPSDIVGPLQEAARSQLKGEVEKLASTLAGLTADVTEQEAMLAATERQLEKTHELTAHIEKRLEGLEDLNEQGLVRLPDLTTARQAWIENTSEIATLTYTIDQGKSRIESRRRKREEAINTARADALTRRADALKRIANLDQQLRRDEQRARDRQLRAPSDGTVYGLTTFTVGGVVTTKDVVMRLVPESATLEAEVMVLNKDIGFVSQGQGAVVKLETFPFTRYGYVEGTVKTVSRDAITDEKQGLVYKAEVALHADRILVGDNWVKLLPGMAVQGEIKTGDRSVIDYFLSPLLKYRDESLRER